MKQLISDQSYNAPKHHKSNKSSFSKDNSFIVHNYPNNNQNGRSEQSKNFYFVVPLSFEQELVPNNLGAIVPLTSLTGNSENICGCFKLLFNKKFSLAKYELYVYNATNPNNKIISAHIHSGDTNQTGPIVVTLYSGAPTNVNGLLSKGVISNNDITLSANYKTVATIYAGILNNNIYVNIHSNGTFNNGTRGNFRDGIIRGQIFSTF